MAILPGTKIGPYEVQSELGAGGMGVVYRARDTKLRRDVAIKVLPEAFTADAERLHRFELEAQALAALNHPHIGAIYGFEEAESIRGLVLELVEGPTLCCSDASRRIRSAAYTTLPMRASRSTTRSPARPRHLWSAIRARNPASFLQLSAAFAASVAGSLLRSLSRCSSAQRRSWWSISVSDRPLSQTKRSASSCCPRRESRSARA